LHSRIGAYKEAEVGACSEEMATELAYHFDRCGNLNKTIKYLELAGERAIARRAYHREMRRFLPA
jgi:hypothetical protein